jgi:hypothetical protein
MGYICCLGGFIEPSKSLGGKYEPSEKFRMQKQTLFDRKTILVLPQARVSYLLLLLFIFLVFFVVLQGAALWGLLYTSMQGLGV